MPTHAFSLDPQAPHRPSWISIETGDAVGRPGGAARVHRIDNTPNGLPAVAKLFNDDHLKKISNPKGYDHERLLYLVTHHKTLAASHPYVAWPTHIITSGRNILVNNRIDPTALKHNIRGVVMNRLRATYPLAALLTTRHVTAKHRSHKANITVAIKLAEHLADLHAAAHKFVFADLSPANIHVDMNFGDVSFIDADGIQMTLPGSTSTITGTARTPGYISPPDLCTPIFTTAHDDFVLAILIFQLLIAHSGAASHPFRTYDGSTESEAIVARRFRFTNIPDEIKNHLDIKAWNQWHPILRTNFLRTFTTHHVLPAREWALLLGKFRDTL